MDGEAIFKQAGRIEMTQWFVDRLTEFAKDHPHTLAMTPQVLLDYLAQMMLDAVKEAEYGTRSSEPLQVRA